MDSTVSMNTHITHRSKSSNYTEEGCDKIWQGYRFDGSSLSLSKYILQSYGCVRKWVCIPSFGPIGIVTDSDDDAHPSSALQKFNPFGIP